MNDPNELVAVDLTDLVARQPLSRRDWTRPLFATEIVFVSDVVGAGVEWPIVTPLGDERTLRILRALQRKLVSIRTGPPGLLPG